MSFLDHQMTFYSFIWKKQKDENDKELLNKYLTVAMKREDTVNNLERFERQQEFEREQKIDRIKKKDITYP